MGLFNNLLATGLLIISLNADANAKISIYCPHHVTCNNGHCSAAHSIINWHIDKIYPSDTSGVILFWEANGYVLDNLEHATSPAICIYIRHKGGSYAEVHISGGKQLQADNTVLDNKWQPKQGDWWQCVMSLSSSDPTACPFTLAVKT